MNLKSFKYKAKLLGNTVANGILKKCNNCWPIKIFKQFLEINGNAIDSLQSKIET